ncbi:carbon-nitrogen hydrolase family protein [Tersicoccus sp. Bi-70]|uniref:carbon-nitrogen hydrolase family protein n=1 Tax=Tersicoccus sp. Bi-70 TaxID=1897634 RepID=UPI001E3AFB63|nr:carbon-nitrogen hydrolase family protein [Tersicoccus sp. Bi-70]
MHIDTGNRGPRDDRALPPDGRSLRVAAVQHRPLAADPADPSVASRLDAFAAELDEVLTAVPDADLVVFPELHLVGVLDLPEDERVPTLQAAAVPLTDPVIGELDAIAAARGIGLAPGSLCERGADGELFNTSLLFAADGTLTATYRKIFPWRPFEPYTPGDRFVVAALPLADGAATRAGLSICYDAWFPEHARHLAWQGAELVLNVVQTTTPDRAQELVLARANAIVNQTFVVSVNTAGPHGAGRSIVVDPEGHVLAEAEDAQDTVLVADLDLDAVPRVRETGTAGTNRMWEQFLPTDPALELPMYGGRIHPEHWTPGSAPPPSP